MLKKSRDFFISGLSVFKYKFIIYNKNIYIKYKKQPEGCCLLNGVHEGIRTPDRTLRRRVLYPAELRRHCLLSTTHL